MAIGLDLFSGVNFRNTIYQYCNQLNWEINSINDNAAILKFSAASGNTQTLFIVRHQNTLEFSVPSGLRYTSISDVPGSLSASLLSTNSEFKVGFWCIEKIDDFFTISFMHNAEMNLIDVNYFRTVIEKAINECDALEQAFVNILSSC